jgi:hypothetical protein
MAGDGSARREAKMDGILKSEILCALLLVALLIGYVLGYYTRGEK